MKNVFLIILSLTAIGVIFISKDYFGLKKQDNILGEYSNITQQPPPEPTPTITEPSDKSLSLAAFLFINSPYEDKLKITKEFSNETNNPQVAIINIAKHLDQNPAKRALFEAEVERIKSKQASSRTPVTYDFGDRKIISDEMLQNQEIIDQLRDINRSLR